MDLPSAADNTIGTTVQSSTTEQDELSQRLARLRQVWLHHVIRRKKIKNKTFALKSMYYSQGRRWDILNFYKQIKNSYKCNDRIIFELMIYSLVFLPFFKGVMSSFLLSSTFIFVWSLSKTEIRDKISYCI